MLVETRIPAPSSAEVSEEISTLSPSAYRFENMPRASATVCEEANTLELARPAFVSRSAVRVPVSADMAVRSLLNVPVEVMTSFKTKAAAYPAAPWSPQPKAVLQSAALARGEVER